MPADCPASNRAIFVDKRDALRDEALAASGWWILPMSFACLAAWIALAKWANVIASAQFG
ncbi:hypothetical protein [Rhodovulum strictum]|uniref:Uncharacterized protein n=1 Tax=Rhodovulum strictum TaxID=58314 RepID=A0A844BAE8_9RHOB|nr:hypothetical protein [Rhodovulum strictum]MRH21384.1 hypothetical protein [Rhodovulum strictum]